MAGPEFNNPNELSPAVRRALASLKRTADSAALLIANNLSDLADASVARTNLGLGSFAVLSSLDHSALTGLTTGDPHTQYALSAGDTYTGVHNFSGTVQRSATDAKMLVMMGKVVATGTITLTATPAVVTGATVTLSLVTGDLVVINGMFDTASTSATTTAVGVLAVGGSAQTGQAVFQAPATATRFTVGQNWTYTAGSTGSVTFDLRGQLVAGGATMQPTHTGFSYMVFR